MPARGILLRRQSDTLPGNRSPVPVTPTTGYRARATARAKRVPGRRRCGNRGTDERRPRVTLDRGGRRRRPKAEEDEPRPHGNTSEEAADEQGITRNELNTFMTHMAAQSSSAARDLQRQLNEASQAHQRAMAEQGAQFAQALAQQSQLAERREAAAELARQALQAAPQTATNVRPSRHAASAGGE